MQPLKLYRWSASCSKIELFFSFEFRVRLAVQHDMIFLEEPAFYSIILAGTRLSRIYLEAHSSLRSF